jgi:hypothetical protein
MTSDRFSQLTAILGAVIGIVSVAVVLAEWYVSRSRARAALESATESVFGAAIRSDELKQVGSYLYDRLGAFKIADYAADVTVRRRVERLLNRARDFIGESGQKEPDSVGPTSYSPRDSPTTYPEPSSTLELSTAERELRSGNIWNGLARIRRLIEMRLRKLAERSDIRQRKGGAGALLAQLEHLQVIPTNLAQSLRDVISVANRGVHGLDVSLNDAERAIRDARNALSGLEAIASRPPTPS